MTLLLSETLRGTPNSRVLLMQAIFMHTLFWDMQLQVVEGFAVGGAV